MSQYPTKKAGKHKVQHLLLVDENKWPPKEPGYMVYLKQLQNLNQYKESGHFSWNEETFVVECLV